VSSTRTAATQICCAPTTARQLGANSVWNVAYSGERYAFPSEVTGVVLFSDATPANIETAVCTALTKQMPFGPSVNPVNVRTTFWLSKQKRSEAAPTPTCAQLVPNYNLVTANTIINRAQLPNDDSARLLIVEGKPNGVDASVLAGFVIPASSTGDAVNDIVSKFATAIVQDPKVIAAFQSSSQQVASTGSQTPATGQATQNGIQPSPGSVQTTSFWSSVWSTLQPYVGPLISFGIKVLIFVVSAALGIPTTAA
jgi:hypothetical protein